MKKTSQKPRASQRAPALTNAAGAPFQAERRSRELLLELWSEIRTDWGFAATQLAGAMRQQRLGSKERRFISETLYGMIRQARRIDYALQAAGRRLPTRLPRELAQFLVYRVLVGDISAEDAGREIPDIDWEEVGRIDQRIAKERDPIRRFGLTHSFPDWLAERFIAEFGDEAEALARALNERAPLTLRVNTLKTTREALLARLRAEGIEATPAVYSKYGVVLDTRVDVWSLDAFREGWFEAQDEASQLVAEATAPPPKGWVLDACAGAGGKTLALGALMEGKGRILALDIEPRKIEELRKRSRRAGLNSVQAFVTPETSWPAEVEIMRGRFDRVLVDAPCSGIGSLRRNPEIRWRLSREDIARLVTQQESLIRRALGLVAVGGRLIYATCTILSAENEEVIKRIVAGHPAFELVRLAEVWGNQMAQPLTDATSTFLKTLPHHLGTDGFFAAVLRRRA